MAKTHKIPTYKKKQVKEYVDLINSSSTILIASIKNLPSSQFQSIGKKLRGKAAVRVPKKNLMIRAIEESKKESLQPLKEKIDNSVAVLFSNMDAYELAGILLKNKNPAKAKPGQIAPKDLEVLAGPTDLVPGPAISELGAVGIKIAIKAGKIEISQDKVLTKTGDVISQQVADILSKLDIKPFSIGYVPTIAFDLKNNIFYDAIEINEEKALNELKEAYARSLPFAVNVGYATNETIKLMVQKAGREEIALGKKTNSSEVNTGASQ